MLMITFSPISTRLRSSPSPYRQQRHLAGPGEPHQFRIDRRFVLVDVETGAGDVAGFDQFGQVSSSITSPRAVLTMKASLRISLRRRADSRWKVAGCRTVHRKDVHPRQHLVEALPIGRASSSAMRGATGRRL